MNYYMVRSFDHAGYYETRSLLLLVGIGVAIYFARRRDYRYMVMFASGVVFQALMEWRLSAMGLRGKGYSLSVFGVTLPPALAMLWQGLAEGGILSLMAFWFADLFYVSKQPRPQAQSPSRGPYYAACLLIVVLAVAVGLLARGLPVSSPRPMFARLPVTIATVTIVVSLILLIALRGRTGLRALGWFYLGLLVYIVLTFEPLHWLGARYIAVRDASGQFSAAPFFPQVGFMLYSHLYEVAGGKIHYFVVPYVLGLLSGGKGSSA